jgi:hypothetical protein
MVILQHGNTTIKSAKAIRERLTSRMDARDKGSVKIIVQGTVRDMEAHLLKRQDRQSPEHEQGSSR